MLFETVEARSVIVTDSCPCYSRLVALGYRHNKAITGGDRAVSSKNSPQFTPSQLC